MIPLGRALGYRRNEFIVVVVIVVVGVLVTVGVAAFRTQRQSRDRHLDCRHRRRRQFAPDQPTPVTGILRRRFSASAEQQHPQRHWNDQHFRRIHPSVITLINHLASLFELKSQSAWLI